MAEKFSLHTLGYVSRATADMSDRGLAVLQAQASRLNALDGVTGLLIYTGSHFAQIVEGAESAIAELVERLKKDRRHTDLRIYFTGPIAHRAFPSWDMKTVQVSPTQEVAMREIQALYPGRMNDGIKDKVNALLANCYA